MHKFKVYLNYRTNKIQIYEKNYYYKQKDNFMEKNLYIDASHPDETRIVLKSQNHIEEYEYENKNKLHLKNQHIVQL